MHTFEVGSSTDRAHLAMCSATIESLAVAASQDRTVVSFTDREVDRSSGSRHERDGRRFVALAEVAQRAMAALGPEIFDIGYTRF